MKTRITISLISFFAFSGFIFSQSLSNYQTAKNSSYVEGRYYVEGFEWGAFPPNEWQVVNVEGPYSWDLDPWTYGAYRGERNVYINYQITTCMMESWANGIKSIQKTACSGYEITTKENDWLITPRYLTGPEDSLIFYAKPYYMQGDTNRFFVKISLDETVPSDSSKVDAAFSVTLMDIDIASADRNWRKYSISLSKYAGQKIYIGFNNYCVNGTGLLLDDIRLGKQPAADISAAAFEINKFYRAEDKIALKAKFVNYGKETQKFYAICEIPQESYKSEKLIENIAGDSVIAVQFDSIKLGNGRLHDAIFYTKLNTDENLLNDTLKGSFYAVEKLNSSAWHLEPDLVKNHWLNGSVSYIQKSENESAIDTALIYIIGGMYKDSACLDSVFIYNSVTRKWSEADFILPKKINHFVPVQVGGKIYIAGGYDWDAHTRLTSLLIYDIKEKKLTEGAPMLFSVYNYSIGVYRDSLIYLIGGTTQNNLQIYNIRENRWDYGTPIKSIDAFTGNGTIVDNKIVLLGWKDWEGIVSIGTIDKNDLYNITWSEIPYPGMRSEEVSTGSWDGKKNKYVFFAGGRLMQSYTSETWIYDVINEKWLYAPNKINACSMQANMVSVIRNDSVYMVAGGGRGDEEFPSSNEWLFIGIDEPDPYIGISEEPNITSPKEYSLSQNYPNPFNPSTKIKYSLREPGHVSLTVYDMLGREIKTLINELMSAGEHEVIFNAAELNLSSGVYIYRIKSGGFMQTKKLMLLK